MMKRSSDGGMVCFLVLGYAVILNVIGASQHNLYSTELLIGAAFAIGIAMVVGSVLFFMAEPRIKPGPDPAPEKVKNPFHTLIRRAIAAPA
jgi:hypothetical protein